MNQKQCITYIDFKKWNNKVIKVGSLVLGSIFFTQLLLFFMFKPTADFSKEEYFLQFVFLPTLIQGLILIYLYLLANVLDKYFNQYVISVLIIIGEVAFTLVAISIHSSVQFMCIVLLHPIMLTSVYKDRIFCWFASFISIVGYGLIVFGIIPSVEYKPNNSPLVYFITFITVVILTAFWSLTVKEINIQFDKSTEELRNTANVMKSAAELDSLTGLYNHNAFYKRLDDKLLNNKTSLHIVVIDIDNFKKVNDTYGHVAGDYVITRVSNIIKKTIKEQDFAGRYGGEEFVSVYENITKVQAFDIAENIRKECMGEAVEYKNENGKYEINYTVSIGIASCDENIRSSQQLFQYADKALYIAKNSGKNKVFFNNSRLI